METVTGHLAIRKFPHHSAHVLRTRRAWYGWYLGLFCNGEFVGGEPGEVGGGGVGT